MSFQEDFETGEIKATLTKKEDFKKKGIRYLIIAAVCLLLSFIGYSADLGGALFAAVNMVMLITFLGGAYYLIRSFTIKE